MSEEDEAFLFGTECRPLKYDSFGMIKYWRGMSGANRYLVQIQRSCARALSIQRCVNPWMLSSDDRDEYYDMVARMEEIYRVVVDGLEGRGEDAREAARIELKLIFKAMD